MELVFLDLYRCNFSFPGKKTLKLISTQYIGFFICILPSLLLYYEINLPRCWSGEKCCCEQIYRSCYICPKGEVHKQVYHWRLGWPPSWMRNTTEYPNRQTSTRACYQRNLFLQDLWCSSRRICLLRSWHIWYHHLAHHGWWLYPVLLSLNIHKRFVFC